VNLTGANRLEDPASTAAALVTTTKAVGRIGAARPKRAREAPPSTRTNHLAAKGVTDWLSRNLTRFAKSALSVLAKKWLVY
jgi:hypothetical protein